MLKKKPWNIEPQTLRFKKDAERGMPQRIRNATWRRYKKAMRAAESSDRLSRLAAAILRREIQLEVWRIDNQLY